MQCGKPLPYHDSGGDCFVGHCGDRGQGLCIVPVGHIPLSSTGTGNHPALGVYLQDTGILLGETLPETDGSMVYWAWVLDKGEPGNLPACDKRKTKTGGQRSSLPG